MRCFSITSIHSARYPGLALAYFLVFFFPYFLISCSLTRLYFSQHSAFADNSASFEVGLSVLVLPYRKKQRDCVRARAWLARCIEGDDERFARRQSWSMRSAALGR